MKFEEAAQELLYDECDFIASKDKKDCQIALDKYGCFAITGMFADEDYKKSNWQTFRVDD